MPHRILVPSGTSRRRANPIWRGKKAEKGGNEGGNGNGGRIRNWKLGKRTNEPSRMHLEEELIPPFPT